MHNLAWPLLYPIFHFLATTAFVVSGWYSFILAVGSICCFYFYQKYFFSAISLRQFTWRKMLFSWFIGGLIKFSYLPLIDVACIGVSRSQLCIGWFLCACGLLGYEVIFTLGVHALCKKLPSSRPRSLVFLMLLLVQQLMLVNRFFLFLGQNKGLATNNIFLPLCASLLSLFPNVNIASNDQQVKFIFLPSLARISAALSHKPFDNMDHRKIFTSLVTSASRWPASQAKVFLAPESFFAKSPPLREKKRWQEALYPSDLIIAGACQPKGCSITAAAQIRSFQTAIVLSKAQICTIYKQVLCPLYEERFIAIPSEKLMKECAKVRVVSNYQVAICSEFFLAPGNMLLSGPKTLLLLVKENFFPTFFYKMLLASAVLFSLWHQQEIIWVDYNGLRIINFFAKVGT